MDPKAVSLEGTISPSAARAVAIGLSPRPATADGANTQLPCHQTVAEFRRCEIWKDIPIRQAQCFRGAAVRTERCGRWRWLHLGAHSIKAEVT
jgi:hypothetical protein